MRGFVVKRIGIGRAPLGHFVETDDGQVRRVGLLRWAKAFENFEKRLVAVDYVGPCRISTVFLGIDHGWGGTPLIYETMIFYQGSDSDLACDRYPTRELAWAGHQVMLQRVLAGEFDPVTDNAVEDEQGDERA